MGDLPDKPKCGLGAGATSEERHRKSKRDVFNQELVEKSNKTSPVSVDSDLNYAHFNNALSFPMSHACGTR